MGLYAESNVEINFVGENDYFDTDYTSRILNYLIYNIFFIRNWMKIVLFNILNQ